MIEIAYADGWNAPRLAPDEAIAAAGLAGPWEVTLGFTVEPHPWLADPGLRGHALLAGYALGEAVADGRLTPLAVRLGSIPTMLRERRPDLAVVTGVRRGDRYGFCRNIGWADVLAEVAGSVVVEIDEGGPDLGGPDIAGNIVAEVARTPVAASPPAQRPIDGIDRTIGEYVVSLFPPDPTVQFGIGGVAEAIAASIDRPVRLWTGMLTDTAAELCHRGLVDQPPVAAYTWGGEPIQRLHADGSFDLVSATVTHDPGRLASIDRFVSCNGALQVGLDGSVNLERVAGRTVAGIGGHADFCAGATRSAGGVSIVATRSTTTGGGSCIVPMVEVVSTPRSDVGVVVTEYGIADLRGVGDAERARRLISIAAPHHRDSLRVAAAGA